MKACNMNTKTWRWFRYDEIFEIKKGFYNKKPEENPQGDIPFIGATDSNNGVTSMHDLETIEKSSKTGDENNAPLKEKLFEPNCITVSNNGSVGYAFYQTKKFTCSHDVNPLYLKDYTLNAYIAMFLCGIIEKEQFRWAYGRKWRPIRMPSSKIKLPINDDNKPDWEWIEKYIKIHLIEKLPRKTKAVWNRQFDKRPMSNEIVSLHAQLWEWFIVDNLFNVQAGKYHYSEEYESGKTPYLSATAENNGLCKWINLESEFEAGTITNEKVHCTTFYQPTPFCATSDVNVISLKQGQFNKYVGLFLATIIEFSESYKWTYGRQCRKNDTEKIRIKLPVKSPGQPNWEWMEDYIKSLPYSKCL